MKNLKVSMKLIVSFAIVIILMAFIGIYAITNMTSMDQQSGEMYTLQTEPLVEMGKVIELLQRMRINLREYALGSALGDNDMITVAAGRVNSYYSVMDESLRLYRLSIDSTTEAGRRALELFDDAERLYRTRFLEILNLAYEMARDGEDAAVIQAKIGEYTADINAVVEKFEECMDLKLGAASTRNDAISAMADTSVMLIIIILIVSIAIAVFLTFYISSLISKPLITLSNFMKKAGTTGDIALSPADAESIGKMSLIKDEIGQAINGSAAFVKHVTGIAQELEVIADGDLTSTVKLLSDADTMSKSLQHMVENLNTMFAEINGSTGQVSSGSKQIADGAQTLAQGSTEQAASIQELSASIAEIAERTKANAEIADRTAKLSESIKESAEKGSHQMDDMIAAVKDINDASQSISKIIKTIDDIAFQTNILALNAAVEAARAGQHGKGFAVVAEEVRNLASKSAEAAKDTGDMIQNSMSKAELGSKIAKETAESLSDIVAGINESSQLVAEIARASEAQTIGIAQINSGIDQVAQVVQQNSATAEQSAAASEEMSGQADMLQQLISQFKLQGGNSMLRSLPTAVNPVQNHAPPPIDSDPAYSGSTDSDFGKY